MATHRLASPTELRRLLAYLDKSLKFADELKLDRVGIDIATACVHLQQLIDVVDLRSER